MRSCIDIGIFAHNEGAGIDAMLSGLLAQDIHTCADLSVRVLVLANGCADDTAAKSRRSGIEVIELVLGGKSRTWNAFVHDLSRAEASVLVFCDADIELPVPDALQRLVRNLMTRPCLRVLSSQPVKDIVARPNGLSLQERLIVRATGGLDDWRSSICGQLYAMPTHEARRFHLPLGLPVEDGFLRAIVLTDALIEEEEVSRIDGLDGVYHIYESERTVAGLIRHQVRIVIGGAVNVACFCHLSRLPPSNRFEELAMASHDEGWLARVLAAELPRGPDGYVPVHFLTKRILRARSDWLRPARWPVLVAGIGFDLIVFVLAQVRMARGSGAGFW